MFATYFSFFFPFGNLGVMKRTGWNSRLILFLSITPIFSLSRFPSCYHSLLTFQDTTTN